MFKKLILASLLSAGAWCGNSQAALFILSDAFQESDPTIQNLFEDGPPEMLPYREYGPFSVDSSATFEYTDAVDVYSYFELFSSQFFDNDVTVTIHDAPLDTSDPQGSVVAALDDFDEVDLTAGTEYWIVVQPYSSLSGAREFGVILDGNATVSGGGFKRMPNFFAGRFDEDDDLTNIIPPEIGCPDSYYEVAGPFRVSQTGHYYIGNMTLRRGAPLNLAIGVYEGSFDPDKPYENQIRIGPNRSRPFLEVGKDYLIVVQPDCNIVTGRYLYVIAPPEETFVWSVFAGGSYADGAVPSQGVLWDVFPDLNAVFGAWFTFANTAPDLDAESDVGRPEHRWMVMFGTFDSPRDTVVEMDVFAPEGGMFNMPDDPANVPQPKVGTFQLDMNRQCQGGEGHFDLDSGLSGTIKLRRITNANLESCMEQDPRPGPWYDFRAN